MQLCKGRTVKCSQMRAFNFRLETAPNFNSRNGKIEISLSKIDIGFITTEIICVIQYLVRNHSYYLSISETFWPNIERRITYTIARFSQYFAASFVCFLPFLIVYLSCIQLVEFGFPISKSILSLLYSLESRVLFGVARRAAYLTIAFCLGRISQDYWLNLRTSIWVRTLSWIHQS